MQREASRRFGVILERRPATSKWADWVWGVVAVVPDAPDTVGWVEIERQGEVVRYLSASYSAVLHHKMVEAYDANIEIGSPAMWAALMEDNNFDPPWRVIGVTVDPYQAQSWLEAGEGLIERVPMPLETVAWMANFLKALPEPPKFSKRKRDSVPIEEAKFGKEPIFAPGGRTAGKTEGS